MHDHLKTWNPTDILNKVCMRAMIFVLLAIGMKVTFVSYSELSIRLDKANLPIEIIIAMVFCICWAMFMIPIVPGALSTCSQASLSGPRRSGLVPSASGQVLRSHVQ